jgi:hypothetical protein
MPEPQAVANSERAHFRNIYIGGLFPFWRRFQSRANADAVPFAERTCGMIFGFHLQFGRDLSIRRNNLALVGLQLPRAAFNSAATFRSRKLDITFIDTATNNALQFGRDLSIAETTIPTSTAGVAKTSFNSAATFRSRKRLGWWALGYRLRFCFNSAATFRSRKRADRRGAFLRSPRFNSAATFRSRKRCSRAKHCRLDHHASIRAATFRSRKRPTAKG